jgi:hypothetical protein
MSRNISSLNREMTLGPLTEAQRIAIMRHARPLSQRARRQFRRLMILAQERGLNEIVIARAAAQAQEHEAEAAA